MKEKVLMFGTGSGAANALKLVDEGVEIIGFIDNNKDKQGMIFQNKKIYAPEEILSMEYSKIVICSVAILQIKEQLISIGIDESKIVDKMYFHERRFLERYDSETYNKDIEVREIVESVKKKGLKVFNYPFNETYDDLPVDVFWDNEKQLFYVMYNNKKMYMSKKQRTEENVKAHVRWLYTEQDEKSPHRYLTNSFGVDKKSIVVDAGVAEGNFALDIIDDVEKIILIETDDDWIEALQYTFEPYKEKVQIIKGFLGNSNQGDNITLDSVLPDQHIDFIKMDIEGSEPDALIGASKILRNSKPKLDICVYHNEFDQKKIEKILEQYDYQMETSQGYMVFLFHENINTAETMPIVRGLIRAW